MSISLSFCFVFLAGLGSSCVSRTINVFADGMPGGPMPVIPCRNVRASTHHESILQRFDPAFNKTFIRTAGANFSKVVCNEVAAGLRAK
jgi:hypothetical protein